VSALSAAEGERGVDKREVRGLYLTVYWRKIGWNRAVLESCAGNVLGADSQRELAKGALTALSCWRSSSTFGHRVEEFEHCRYTYNYSLNSLYLGIDVFFNRVIPLTIFA
jgi:hypothetical protein